MKAQIDLDEKDIRAAIAAYIEDRTGVGVPDDHVLIQVKSKQNYKSEWEEAAIRCSFYTPLKG